MPTIRPAVGGDVEAMRVVGARAGRLFATVEDPRVARCAADPPFAVEELQAYVDAGRAWVAVQADITVVGFAVVDELDGCAHLEEIGVDPGWGGQGIGSALLDVVAAWASASGFGAMTLTTFVAVPWNRPFYERRGWRVLDPVEIRSALAERIAEEASAGLDPTIRVAMRRDL